jgi:glycolate oxidase
MSDIYSKLEEIVSDKYISNDIYVRHAYSRTVDIVLQGVPDIVIRPKDAQEISEILKIANQENIPVIPRGGGAGEFGGAKPIGDNGIVLDTKRMNNILNLDQDNLIVTVESGISWGKLNDYLSQFGLYTGCMGPGSGMAASIGGGVSHHSVGGGGGAKYGACTNQVVSMEVVLPTGEIINTGSLTNVFTKFPFIRYGNGADFTGLFCGDNGIYGIKTKISLKIFPRPPFAAYKTYAMPRKANEISAQIFTEIRQKGIDVYDAMYIMDLVIRIGCEQGMFPMWEQLKKKRGVVFYTIEANSETELEQKVKELDKIFLSKKSEELGPEISDGNIAKWHYVEQGHWQLYHNLWGIVPGLEAIVSECFTPIKVFPKLLADLDQWDIEHSEDMQKFLDVTGFRPITGSGPILLVDGNNVEVTCGIVSFASYYDEKFREDFKELNLKLWKSMIERVARHGVQYYMLGDIGSRHMVDIGAYSSEYYNFMKSIKKVLDPNMILSRGKFNFGGVKNE